MTPPLRVKLLLGASLAAMSFCGPAWADDEAAAADGSASVEGVVVTGARTRTSAVTGLDMSLRETPQSVTIGVAVATLSVTGVVIWLRKRKARTARRVKLKVGGQPKCSPR